MINISEIYPNTNKWGVAAALFVVAMIVPASTLAAGGGSSDDLSNALLLIAMVGVAYLVAHLLLERIAERFGFVTGVEYVLLGALLVPGLEIVSEVTIDQLTPAVVLGAGSIGLLRGIYVDFDRLRLQRHREAFRVALLVSVPTLFALTAIPALAIGAIWGNAVLRHLMPGLICLGAIGVVAEPRPIQSLTSYLGAESSLEDKAVSVARYTSTIGLIAFGLIFCFYNPVAFYGRDPVLPWAQWNYYLAWLPWFGVHLVLGVVLGFMFSGFLGRDYNDESLLTVLMGMVIFTSGIASYLNLSPIFVNFVLGVVLSNTCSHRDHIRSMLNSIEHPLYIVLFFFAGAKWRLLDGTQGYLMAGAVVVGYLTLRRTGRTVGSILSANSTTEPSYSRGVGRALMASGALSVAMLLDFQGMYPRLMVPEALYEATSRVNYAPVIYTGILFSIVVTEIYAYFVLRRWFLDNSDLSAVTREDDGDGQGSDL